jgi:hypothetical protein
VAAWIGRTNKEGRCTGWERRSPEPWSASAWPAPYFLGAGAAVAQTADDSSSSSSTTTAQDSQSTQAQQNGGTVDCPEGSGAQSDSGQSSE